MNPGAADWRSIAVICSATVIFPHPLGSSVNRPVSFQPTPQDIIRNSPTVLLPLDAPVFHYLCPPPFVRAAQNRIVGEISCRSCRFCPRGSLPSRAGARPGAWGFCREVSIPMEARPFYSGFRDHHVQFPPPSNLNRHQRVGIQTHAKKQKFSPQCTPGFPARQQTGGLFRKERTFPLSSGLNSRRSGKISGSLLRKADHGGNVRHGPGFAYRSRAFRTPHSASSFFAKFFPPIKPSRFQLCLIHRKAPMDAIFLQP